MTREYSFRGKAITVQEPWASAIAYAGKNIENREVRIHFRGPVAIHAASETSVRWEDLERGTRVERGGEKRPLRERLLSGHRKFWGYTDGEIVQPGQILAIAMIVDCVERSSSPWFQGTFGYVLEEIIPIRPVPMKGAFGLWNVRFQYEPLR